MTTILYENAEALSHIWNENYPDFPMTKEQFQKTVLCENCHVITEKTNGETVGFAVVEENDLRLILVKRGAQRAGIGTKLLSRAEAFVKSRGYSEINLGGHGGKLFIGADKKSWDFFKKAGYTYEKSCDEMLLSLRDFSGKPLPLPDGFDVVRYHGDLQKLRDAVNEVEPSWVKYYTESTDVLAVTCHGEIASFCLLEYDVPNYISYSHGRVGMPGCVGTLPNYRGLGIGLRLISEATKILRERGMDVSYVYYTEVAPFYEKLGYKTFLTECFGKKAL